MASQVTIRIAIPSVAVSILLLGIGGIAAWYVNRQQAESTATLASDLAAMQAAEKLTIEVREIRYALNRFLISGDRGPLSDVPPLLSIVGERLRQVAAVAGEDEQPLVDRLWDGYLAFQEQFRLAMTGTRNADFTATMRRLSEQVATPRLIDAAHEFLETRQQSVTETSRRNQVAAGRVALGLLLFGACGSVGGVLAGFGVARGISRSFVQLQVPVRDAAGKLQEVVGPVNVAASTDLEGLDAALRQMAIQVGEVVDRLQESQREVLRSEQLAALGQLAAGLAHEMRNPMTAMKILVQSATAPGGDGSLRGRDLTIIHEELARLERSISMFLDFARPPRLEIARCDIRPIIASAVEVASARAKMQCVVVEFAFGTEVGWVAADATQVRQVVLNLLLNALDALPEGGSVRVELLSGDGGVIVRVRDTGQGIPADILPRIFEPFVSTKEAGLGLGLAICRRIVEAHGGRIWAENAAEGGALLSIWLPLAT